MEMMAKHERLGQFPKRNLHQVEAERLHEI
jgi:hypothetical protein